MYAASVICLHQTFDIKVIVPNISSVTEQYRDGWAKKSLPPEGAFGCGVLSQH